MAGRIEGRRNAWRQVKIMAIDEELLKLLACPACEDRPPVKLQGEELICEKCKRAYPIKDGIPVMLIEKATKKE